MASRGCRPEKGKEPFAVYGAGKAGGGRVGGRSRSRGDVKRLVSRKWQLRGSLTLSLRAVQGVQWEEETRVGRGDVKTRTRQGVWAG